MNAKRTKQIRQAELNSELGTTPSLIRKARRIHSRSGLLKSQKPKIELGRKNSVFPKNGGFPKIISWLESTNKISDIHRDKKGIKFTMRKRHTTRVIC